MRSTLGRGRSAVAIWSAFRQAGQNLLRRSKPTKAGTASLISVVAIICGTPQQARAQVTYTYTGNPFDVSACDQLMFASCPSGNLTASATFSVSPFSGQLTPIAVTLSTPQFTLTYPSRSSNLGYIINPVHVF
jgi:hypothetical protein